ncbi:MAG: hypothetical protein CML05_18170 [Pseudozobellia sp.]|nr:hypothetical protein [Pseudozobellia sp.]|tara:strand:+ start:136 stop:405 length:270 start_codon:yes stop_codon:yes gene_type:complete
MASVKNLKKDINNVFGDIIEAVYIVDGSGSEQTSKEGDQIIDEAINNFDELISKVNDKNVDNRKKHLKEVRLELETKAQALVEKVNKLN